LGGCRDAGCESALDNNKHIFTPHFYYLEQDLNGFHMVMGLISSRPIKTFDLNQRIREILRVFFRTLVIEEIPDVQAVLTLGQRAALRSMPPTRQY
jgi:hypothetical protein